MDHLFNSLHAAKALRQFSEPALRREEKLENDPSTSIQDDSETENGSGKPIMDAFCACGGTAEVLEMT